MTKEERKGMHKHYRPHTGDNIDEFMRANQDDVENVENVENDSVKKHLANPINEKYMKMTDKEKRAFWEEAKKECMRDDVNELEEFSSDKNGMRMEDKIQSVVNTIKEIEAVNLTDAKEKDDMINHPPHYNFGREGYETIEVIEAWNLNYRLGNCIKYISRADKKGNRLEQLLKAQWYLNREIKDEKKKRNGNGE